MFNKTLTVCAILAAAAQAQTDEQKAQYQDWTAIMGLYGYAWEPYEITTEDGYNITLMNVYAKSIGQPSSAPKGNPILVQPMVSIAPSNQLNFFMLVPDGQNPPLLKLFDAGHDLWFLYPRGSPYSSHESLGYNDAEFWNFDLETLARIDMKAAMDFVYTATKKKTSIFGMLAATPTILAGLATEYDFFKDRIDKVLMQGPCRLPSREQTSWYTKSSNDYLNAAGIYELGGQTWFINAGKIAQNIGFEVYKKMVMSGIGGDVKGLCVKGYDQFSQISESQSFGPRSETFWDDENATEPYDLSVIQDIPIGMFMASGDTDCPMDQNEETRGLLGDNVQMFEIYNVTTTDEFMVYNGNDMNDDMRNFLSGNFTNAEYLQ